MSEFYNLILGKNIINKPKKVSKTRNNDLINKIQKKTKKLKIVSNILNSNYDEKNNNIRYIINEKNDNIIDLKDIKFDENGNILKDELTELQLNEYKNILNDFEKQKKEILNNASLKDKNFMSNDIFKAGYIMNQEYWENEIKEIKQKEKELNQKLKKADDIQKEEIKKQIDHIKEYEKKIIDMNKKFKNSIKAYKGHNTKKNKKNKILKEQVDDLMKENDKLKKDQINLIKTTQIKPLIPYN